MRCVFEIIVKTLKKTSELPFKIIMCIRKPSTGFINHRIHIARTDC